MSQSMKLVEYIATNGFRRQLRFLDASLSKSDFFAVGFFVFERLTSRSPMIQDQNHAKGPTRASGHSVQSSVLLMISQASKRK